MATLGVITSANASGKEDAETRYIIAYLFPESDQLWHLLHGLPSPLKRSIHRPLPFMALNLLAFACAFDLQAVLQDPLFFIFCRVPPRRQSSFQDLALC